MPGWFSKRGSSRRSKEDGQLQQLKQQEININNPHGHGKNINDDDLVIIKKKSSSCSKDKNKAKGKTKTKSFDGEAAPVTPPFRISPRGSGSKELLASGSSGGFSGFDSDSADKRRLPLPRPSLADHNGVFGSGSASGSISSVSSSGSSGEDHPMSGNDQHHHHLLANRFGGYNRTNGEIKFNTGSRSPGPGSRSPAPGSRSPVPGSRGTSRPTSPLHPRLGGTSLDYPSGKPEDGKNQCHPLPLPPGSPTSPSSLTSTRTNGMTENTPVSLSKWKKGKLLGRGTFGHVYLGFNSESGQMCAIKEVRVVCDDQTSKESFKQLNQEINLLSQLSHQNIVRYYGSELSEETLSVYLEFVSGGSIHKLLQDYGPFKEPVIQNYTRQILFGLAYLHGRNTVHRDIKGANILVDPNGEVKLADFGMAKHITACSSMLSFKGSPYWMAPEVVMNTNGYSLAVDIWSLGCTILEMATSKPPWSQYEGVAAIFKIGNSKDMPDIPNNLSNDAKSFITLCLQRDPSGRPTASQLLDHPFVQDQAATRVANISITRDVFSFDGSRTPPILEPHSIVTKGNSSNGDLAMNPLVSNKRVPRRDDARMITSLPVSPCSSPLRHNEPAYKSCFLSPPHPACTLAGQSGYNLNDYSLYPLRPSRTYTQDPVFENSLLKVQAPGASPRTRPI